MNKLSYRPDIDGLRAIAVLAVVLFHAELGMEGGYVGVDVFFVISGYLITAILRQDIEAGEFSMLDFWERRVRRILPALAVVIATCLIVGWLLYFPANLIELGNQVRAQTVFASNILFYSEAGYFDSSNELKALLHTWSLAVEEQFYLLFPILCFILYKISDRTPFFAISFIAAISFGLSVYWMYRDPIAAFYLLPARAWELMIGAMIALYRPQKPLPRRRAEVLGATGLAAILYSVIFYSDDTAFPGVSALLPVLGAAAIILSGMSYETRVAKILSVRPLVFIGMLSYSLYLWHWPVISFVKYLPYFKFNGVTGAACLLISFCLALMSWRYVERPFRKRNDAISRKVVFTCAIAFLIICGLFGHILIVKEGVPSRLNEKAARLAEGMRDHSPHKEGCSSAPRDLILSDNICQTNKSAGVPEFLVWGDSFANSLTPAFFQLSGAMGVNGYIASNYSCPPVPGLYSAEDTRTFSCAQFNDEIMAFVKRNNVRKVFLVGDWIAWLRDRHITLDDPTMTVSLAILRTVKILKDHNVEVVFIVGQPYAMTDPSRYLALEEMLNKVPRTTFVSREGDREASKFALDNLLENLKDEEVRILDLRDKLCDETKCRVEYEGYSLYTDRTHLSVKGAMYVAPLLGNFLK